MKRCIGVVVSEDEIVAKAYVHHLNEKAQPGQAYSSKRLSNDTWQVILEEVKR